MDSFRAYIYAEDQFQGMYLVAELIDRF